MEPQIFNEEKPKSPNRNLIIAAVVIVVLCCCCVIVASVGFFAYNTITSRETSSVQSVDEDFAPVSPFDTSTPPAGGLGNDILKQDTWNTMVPIAIGFGCDQPSAEDSYIEVLQEPADKVWVEKWTVVCASGDSYDFEVEFILDDTGATFNIKYLQ